MESIRNILSRRSEHRVQPVRHEKCFLEKDLKRAFGVVDVYLWMHGIGRLQVKGFGVAANTLISAFSAILLIVFEGNVLYRYPFSFWYLFYCEREYFVRAEAASLFFFVLTFILRIVFYSRRETLQHTWHELVEMYAKVSSKKTFGRHLKTKMILLMFFADAFDIYNIVTYIDTEFTAKYDFLQYAQISMFFSEETLSQEDGEILDKCLKCLYLTYLPVGAIVAYFYSVCVLLEEILLEMMKNLQDWKGNVSWMRLYGEVLDLMDDVDAALRPFLLIYCSFLFCFLFYNCYMLLYVFLWTDVSYGAGLFCIVDFLLLAASFVLVCLFSNRVVNAAAAACSEAQKLSYPVSDSERFLFLLRMNQPFPGFQILDSISLNSSFILTGIDSFFSYGLLVASFDSMNPNEADNFAGDFD